MNVADLLRRSIFTQQGRVSFSGALLSMMRFVLGLDGIWWDRLRIAESVFSWPDSLRKGFAEDLGLVMATVVAHDVGWDGEGPAWADLDRQYWGSSNNRPDLIFGVGGGNQVLGEAKGAVRRSAAILSPPSADQLAWLTELEKWGEEFDCKWFLAATWGSRDHVVVDYFDPGEPVPLLPPELLDIAVRTRETQMHQSAPRTSIGGAAPSGLRGVWTSVPSSNEGAEVTSLFLGVLDSALEAPIDRVDEELQVSARGRLVVILRRGGDSSASDPVQGAWQYLDQQSATVTDAFVVLRSQGLHATGRLLPSGEIEVLRGSTARMMPVKSFRPGARRLRDTLISNGTLIERNGSLVFDSSYRFRSPTSAAEQVLGRSANGWQVWTTWSTGDPIGVTRF